MAKSIAELKRKLRDLKRLEVHLRFDGDINRAQGKLIWDDFFSLKSSPKMTSKYGLQKLAKMDRDQFKKILSEFYYYMYFRIYQEKGLFYINIYDPNLLESLGLPMNATEKEIKIRFRELAKKYHPDLGGDAEKFIQLMDVYEQLTGKDS